METTARCLSPQRIIRLRPPPTVVMHSIHRPARQHPHLHEGNRTSLTEWPPHSTDKIPVDQLVNPWLQKRKIKPNLSRLIRIDTTLRHSIIRGRITDFGQHWKQAGSPLNIGKDIANRHRPYSSPVDRPIKIVLGKRGKKLSGFVGPHECQLSIIVIHIHRLLMHLIVDIEKQPLRIIIGPYNKRKTYGNRQHIGITLKQSTLRLPLRLSIGHTASIAPYQGIYLWVEIFLTHIIMQIIHRRRRNHHILAAMEMIQKHPHIIRTTGQLIENHIEPLMGQPFNKTLLNCSINTNPPNPVAKIVVSQTSCRNRHIKIPFQQLTNQMFPHQTGTSNHQNLLHNYISIQRLPHYNPTCLGESAFLSSGQKDG